MRKLLISLTLAGLLAMATVVPAFADHIPGHNTACDAVADSGAAATANGKAGDKGQTPDLSEECVEE